MMTMFEIITGYECGGPEDGMMCRSGYCEYESDVDMSQPLEDVYEQVAAEYRELCKDEPDFLGSRVARIIPEDEAAKVREYWKWVDEHSDGEGNVWP